MTNLARELRDIVEDDLTPERFDAMARAITRSLEETIGRRIAEVLTDDQLDEFEQYVDAPDKAATVAFLDRVVPDYPAVVDAALREHLAVVAAAHHIGLLALP